MLFILICMSEEIPQIQIEKASALYTSYQDVTKFISLNSSQLIPVSKLSGLDGLLTNTYSTFANSLSRMRNDLKNFQKSTEENLEYVIKHIRGQFNGRNESEIQSTGAILGLIPYRNSGQIQGELSGDVNLGIYDFERLTNIVPSNHQWLKDFLNQYVTEINGALESVKAGEPNARLKVGIDRMNNAMKDCYKEETAIRLKFASKSLLGGLKQVREMMFPTNPYYPERVDDFAEETRNYIDSLRALKKFGEEKEKVFFIFNKYHSKVGKFKNELPRPNSKGFWANLSN